MSQHFRDPWSTMLKVVTGVILILVMAVSVTVGPPASWVLIGIVTLGAIFAVRGYSVVDSRLLIHRLGWSTKFELASLSNAEFSPGAMMGSIRVFGIGGLFGFIGRFRNELLGPYRAYATNRENTVVLDFDGAKVVVTPDRPQEFIAALERTVAA